MGTSVPDRREFLTASTSTLGGGWLALHLPALAALSACARDAAERGDDLVTLTDVEASALSAFSERILPSDDTPGATDANVVRFIDLALAAGPFAGMYPLVQEGLADLDARARQEGAEGFAALSPERQANHMSEIESTPFFQNARLLVVAGMFSHPSRGGNQNGAGWTLLQIEHAPSYGPPFGFYDAEVAAAEADPVADEAER